MSRAVLLLSGGFDSVVAGYIMQQKGLEIIALHLSNEPFTDNGPELKAKALAKHLNFKKFIVINVSNIFGDIAKKCIHEYYFVLIKRVMLRVANKVAKEENCNFIITGESLAQVSSQTLDNLKVITEASDIEILRPLLAFDKNDILSIARKIGTYDTSCGPEVCDVLGPKHPATKTYLDNIKKEELKLV